jgi:hypothetical protein
MRVMWAMLQALSAGSRNGPGEPSSKFLHSWPPDKLDQLEELRGCNGPCSSCWVTCGIALSSACWLYHSLHLMEAHENLQRPRLY